MLGRYASSVLIAGLGLVLSVLASVEAGRRELEQNQAELERRAVVLAGAVGRSFQLTREVVLSLPALFEASLAVDEGEFSAFVRPALKRHPSLAALEWAPLVKDEERAAFEAEQRRKGYADFEIREPGPDGKMVRSGRRAEYLPLAFLEPRVEAVRGLEILFEPVRRREIQAAIDHGALHVSHRFRLVEDPEGVASVAVYAPGYDQRRAPSSAAERRASLLGLGIALFRLRPLIDAALAGQIRDEIALALVDPNAPADVRLLYESEPGVVQRAGGVTAAVGDSARFTHREGFDFGNRRYSVICVGRPRSLWRQWLVLGIGLALSAAAAAGYHTLSTIRRLRRAVADRSRLGQYTLEEKIGEGAMGIVYRATHAMLRRPAAVKLLSKNRNSESDLARFEREVQLTSRLAHPNTISIFDYGRTADGLFYYAMEFLDGMDLETLVRENGPLEPARAIHLLAQVSGALGEAHLSGLIHRDIKPGNIVVTERPDEPDVVKVVDFGLVKPLDPSGSQPGITRGDTITGTPLYLAPEGIAAPSTIDERADLYAVGAVAYFLLTGQHVFSGVTIVEVLTRHLAEPPIAPSERVGHPIAADLEALVLKCLSKNREERPRSAAELRRALLACEDARRYDADAARAWWREHGERLRTSARLARQSAGDAATTLAIDLHHRGYEKTASAE